MVSNAQSNSGITAQQHFFDETYQGKQSLLQLFIQISKEQVLLSRFDESTSKYIEFERYELNSNDNWSSAQKQLEQILPLANFQPNKKCSVILNTKVYTLIPQALFDDSKLESYLNFNHTLEEGKAYQFFYNRLESYSAVVVYAIPRSLDFLAKAKLPNFNWHHFSLPLLEALHLNKESYNKLNIHIQQNRFDVIYIPDGKLQFFNSFEYKNSEDFIYYLLYVMEQLKLDRESVTVKLYGEIEENSSIYKLLYNYIRTVEFTKRSSDVNFSNVLAEIPSQYYFNLFNQHLCG